jgi:hypothetical protein
MTVKTLMSVKIIHSRAAILTTSTSAPHPFMVDIIMFLRFFIGVEFFRISAITQFTQPTTPPFLGLDKIRIRRIGERAAGVHFVIIIMIGKLRFSLRGVKKPPLVLFVNYVAPRELQLVA